MEITRQLGRKGGRFGDFVIRAEFVTAMPDGKRFHEELELAG